MTKNTTKLNERLAWAIENLPLVKFWGIDRRGNASLQYPGKKEQEQEFYFARLATSKDDFDLHVLPRLKELGLMEKWVCKVLDRVAPDPIFLEPTDPDDDAGIYPWAIGEMFLAPAHIWALAAAEVLEEAAERGGA